MARDTEKLDRAALAPSGPMRPPHDDSEQRFQPKSFRFWSVIISIFLALFLVALDRTILGTATPQITEEFHSLGDIGWYGSAYQLTTAASQLLFGRVYKFYEIKRTFLITVALFEIGSVICGAAPNSIVFIVGRAIAGLGGAGIFSGVTIIMITMVPLRKRPMFQGLFGTIFGLASVLGPLVGGALTDAITWRWCFYINLPIGAVAALCLIFILEPSRPSHPPATIWEQIRRLDPLGTFFFIPSIVTLLIALQWGGSTYAWSNWRIILLFVLFGVLLFAFGAVQVYLPKTATVPVRIIRRRSILAATIFMFALAGSFLMAIYYLPLWFQVVKGATATQSGVYTLPFVLSLVVGSTLSGIFTQKVGYYVPAMIASPSLLAVGQGLMSTFRVNESSSHWIGFQVIAGFGLGLGMQAASLAAQAVLPMPDVPIGIAIMFFAQQLGGGIFTSVGQNLLSTYLVSNLHIPGLSPDQITSEGATDLVTSVAPEYQLTVKTVYNQAISQIFRCAMGVALVATAAALFMEWKNVKKTGPPPGAGPGARTQPVDDLPSEESSALFIESSPKLSLDNNSDAGRKGGNMRMNGAITNSEESPTFLVPKTGCEHCEHCRLSRALTLSPERQSTSQPLQAPSNRNSRSQALAHQMNAPAPGALEEAARLAAIAREAVAQLEELTRPFSTIGASIDHHPVQSVSRPERAYVPHNVSRHRSLTAPEIPPRKLRREPTTEELVENARRVSAQLEREEKEERTREIERRKERDETEGRRSDRSSRQFSATIFMSSPPHSPTFSPRGGRFPPIS
ncbi:major facilitator superfamily domain-containing protein [Xylaria bambusicola]|uniref:major facilitator superfamily domain-containing protein n=1 Tax=Xylaria bambusicola TaxID=326684 RepID=UPI002007737F|nr:major facilitator superfamily domain-containing protein [Xylaria bambusicola]KAI0514766.1 major facilitator superfamily domain-containing protein [Xylaria bambusicola]